MASLNKVMLLGNVGKGGVECKYLASGDAVANFSIATNRHWKTKDGEKRSETEWHDIVAYRKLAETCSEYLHQGSLVYVEGRKKTDRWEDKETGAKRSKVKIIISHMQMCDRKSDASRQKEKPYSADDIMGGSGQDLGPGGPEELSRLDIRDRGPMPEELVEAIVAALRAAAAGVDVVVLMEQVPDSSSGVLSAPVKRAAAELARQSGGSIYLADSRCDVLGFAGVDIKINREELRRCCGAAGDDAKLAAALARRLGRRVFVTLGADGILAAGPDGEASRAAGIPVAGSVDIVGAGDCVLAHLAMALAAGASVDEAVELANLAASIVIRKIGTTGTATAGELAEALGGSS